MVPPPILAATIEALPEDPRFELTDGWTDRGGGVWSFRFRARLSEPPTAYVKEWTAWHLVVVGDLSDPDIRIYPDAAEGIGTTFPHQDYNGDPQDGLPWRTGKPCLERPMAVFRRDGWAGEPSALDERLVWHIGRLLVWVDAAAAGRLLEPGDPVELPVYPAADTTTVLGFRETVEDLNWWQGHDETWGFATLSKIPGARGTAVIADFMDPMRRSIRRIPWSNAIPLDEGRVDAVWMLLPDLIMFEPWRAATTWQELTQLVANTTIDLPGILADAGARLRRIQRPKHAGPVHLLIGFPLEERVAGEHQRFHWIAIRNMQLCRREDVRKGYSDLPGARRAWDRELAKSPRRLEWRRTANWAPDQLRKRGEAEEAIRSKSILVLGVGTLGAAVAENLLRMGVTRIGLVDDDTMLVANLSRHLLTMADAGQRKAERMAERLNMAAPDAQVVAMPFAFPPLKSADAALLGGWDVVIDCTASDAVLRAMGRFPWVTERLFVSLSMTWQAKGLFAYAASETGFPAIDARERYAAASPPPEEEQVGEMEGIGCWHPVFPATADDVNLWAAIGSKFVRRAVIDRRNTAALFVLGDDGSVKRRDA
jgi:predicted ThiF/HesA family dinucleotide-utilizing enzyme